MKPFTTQQLGQFFDEFKGADLTVTENGINVAGEEIRFNDVLPKSMLPEWEKAKKTLTTLSPAALKNAFMTCFIAAQAGMAVGHEHDPTKGTKVCFKDVHNTGVGVVHVEDTSGALSTLASSMKKAVLECGTSLLSSCSNAVTSNATIIFDWLYHKNTWNTATCDVDAKMVDVAHFAKTKLFDDKHIHCIQSKGIDALHTISMQVHQNLTQAHQNDACHQPQVEDCGTFGTVAATAATVIAAAGVIGCCLQYQKQNGHLPFTNFRIPSFGLFGRQEGYENLANAEHGEANASSSMDYNNR